MSESEILTSMILPETTGNSNYFDGLGLEERDGTSRRYPTKPDIMVINEAKSKPILTDFSTIMLSIDNNHSNFGHSGLKYLDSRAGSTELRTNIWCERRTVHFLKSSNTANGANRFERLFRTGCLVDGPWTL